jgi:hypothetical protein
MSTKCPEIISANNLSHGWGKVFLRLMQPSSKGIPPILLSIGGFTNGQADENCVIRDAVDSELAKVDKCCSCAISAMTIFPHKHWMTRLNCLVAHPELGSKVTKEQLRPLEQIIQEQVAELEV